MRDRRHGLTRAAGLRRRRALDQLRLHRGAFAAAGAYVMGRHMFEGGAIPWGDTPPFRAPVFVLTHRPHAALQREDGTSFTFVAGGIEQAVALAREAAGGEDVAVAGGGTLLRQVNGAGLLEHAELHIAPVVPNADSRVRVRELLMGSVDCVSA